MLGVPGGVSFAESSEHHLYYCPSDRNHREATTFLGLYTGKSVRALGRINRIVVCKSIDLQSESFSFAPGSEQPNAEEKQRILGAARDSLNDRAKNGWHITHCVKYYLCEEMVETDFTKTSKYGFFGHRYFDLREVLKRDTLPESVQEIARLLRERTWE